MKFIKHFFLYTILVLQVTVISCDAQILTGSSQVILKTKRTAFPDFFTVATIGDSNSEGHAEISTPCAVQTLYAWNSTTSALDEITNQSCANTYPQYYSIWQPLATKYKAQFGKPTMVINCGLGGSTIASSTSPYWESGGSSIYPAAKAKINAALTATGETLDAIILNFGINDVSHATTLANITSGLNDVITKLNGDYPGIPVLVIQVGRHTNINSADLYDIRELFVDKCQATTDWYLLGQPQTMSFLSGYETDGVHYNNVTQDYLAQCIVNWFINTGYTKWGRSVISSLFDGGTISTFRKNLIDSVINVQVSNGNYFRLDGWNVFKTTTVNNIFIDWSMIGYGVQRTSTFTANSHIATDGTSGRFDMAYTASFQQRRSTQNNILAGAKLRTNSSVGTSYLFGIVNGTAILGANQIASPTVVKYLINDLTQSAGTDILFQADKLYTVGRTGTTKQFYKNTTLQASTTQASVGTTAQYPLYIGCINSSSTAATFINATFEYSFVSENTSFDLTSFYNCNEKLIDRWNN